MYNYEQAAALNNFWDEQLQKKAADDYYNDVFDAAFELHTAKLAAWDPTYGAILHAEQEKVAFNQGYQQAMASLAQQ